MANEVELKFEIEQGTITQLTTFFNHQSNLKQQLQLQLSNTYYDTADYYLRQQGCGLRVRGFNDCFEITIKTDGKAIAGLHDRAEFNVDLPNNQPNLSALPNMAFPKDCDINQLQQNIIPLFSTDFKRQVWLFSFGNSEIEVALDKGTIVSKNQQIPIQELELELKSGEQFDLFKFAIELTQFNLHLFSQSKAARGYRLMQQRCLEKMPNLNAGEIDLSTILHFWQTNEEYALENDDLPYYQQTLNNIKNHLKSIIKANIKPCDNDSFTLLTQVYLKWCEEIESMTDAKSFAFSSINAKFKLFLMMQLFKC